MKIILIPGLGYDCQIFKNLDLSGFEVEELNWIEPEPKEDIHKYAKRLFSKIEKSSKKTILIGHSLGGVVSQEIASSHTIDKIILVSSIKSRAELPLSIKLVKPLRIDKLFTKEVSIQTIPLWGKHHGFKTNEDQQLFKHMVSQYSNTYLQWALKSLSQWKAPKIPSKTKIVHIHGTKDKTLPYKLVKNPNHTIENGSHICVLKKAEEVSKIIRSII